MGAKILIVDDDATMVNLLSTLLELDGFQPVKALSGREALDLIKADLPDLVLLDIMMPEMDGFEVLSIIREDPKTEKLPVIMLTAKKDDQDIFEGWNKGADEYVTKPFDPRELVRIIQTVLSRTYDERLEERARHVEYLLDLIRFIDEKNTEE